MAQKVDIKITSDISKPNDITYYITKGVEWISHIETRSVTADFTFNVDENTTDATREGEIEFITLPDKTSITVSIVQSGDSELVIPDEIFRAYCIKNFDKNGDGIFSKYEASLITELSIQIQGIKSLEGIEYFTELTYLSCSNNQLTSLDLSKNTELTQLWCYNNKLTSLDISKTNLGRSTIFYPLKCAPMSTLKTLTIKKEWTINGITKYRDSKYIPAQTQIIYVD